MCYPKPGPRCSAHALAALAKAKTPAQKAKAQHDYELTTDGIKAVRASGLEAIAANKVDEGVAEVKRADELQEERNRLIALSKSVKALVLPHSNPRDARERFDNIEAEMKAHHLSFDIKHFAPMTPNQSMEDRDEVVFNRETGELMVGYDAPLAEFDAEGHSISTSEWIVEPAQSIKMSHDGKDEDVRKTVEILNRNLNDEGFTASWSGKAHQAIHIERI